jgi:hypothetical protein
MVLPAAPGFANVVHAVVGLSLFRSLKYFSLNLNHDGICGMKNIYGKLTWVESWGLLNRSGITGIDD